jgi:hypothetical protein
MILGHRTPAFVLDSFMLVLTLRKVLQLSRASPEIPLLRLLLRDAIWAFALVWSTLSNRFRHRS